MPGYLKLRGSLFFHLGLPSRLYGHEHQWHPQLLKNPHRFLVDIAGFQDASLGAQGQVATFFASDGTEVIHPEPVRFFEVPIVLPLPEDLSYIP